MEGAVNVTGGSIIRAFNNSVLRIDTTGYVEVYSDEVYGVGKAKAVSYKNKEHISFSSDTALIQM